MNCTMILEKTEKKQTIKIYSNVSNINIHYYIKIQTPILHRQFFRVTSQN